MAQMELSSNDVALVSRDKGGSEVATSNPPAPENLLAVIAQAVTDPRMDVEKMERLLALHERIMEQQRKAAFYTAVSNLQAKLPQIEKNGRIMVKNQERSRYAKIEDIDTVIRPLLAEEGLALSFDSESVDAKIFKLSCKLSHRDGFFDVKTLTLPMDVSDFRTDVQSVASTVSYGKRYLIKMHLNLIEKEEDDDGNGGDGKITEQQERDLIALMSEAKADTGAFFRYMGVESVKAISSRDYQKAVNLLETKRRGNAR